MKVTKAELIQIETFSRPYYQDKDIMHDWTHIERVHRAAQKLTKVASIEVDLSVVEAALMLHGIIYAIETEIRRFLASIGLPQQVLELIIKVAWESQKEERPITPEGLLLHDAHLLEGGKYFEIIKSLITGSVRGQSLRQTLDYIEQNLLEKGQCYTASGQKQYEVMKANTQAIYQNLREEIQGQDQ